MAESSVLGISGLRRSTKAGVTSVSVHTAPHHSHRSKFLRLITREEMYVERNNEVRSRNNSCGGKAKSMTFAESL